MRYSSGWASYNLARNHSTLICHSPVSYKQTRHVPSAAAAAWPDK